MRQRIERKVLEDVIATTREELLDLPKKSAKERAKRFVKRALGRAGKEDMIFWPAGMLALGLAEAGEYAALEDYTKLWKKKGAQVCRVDDAVFAQAALTAYAGTGDLLFKDAADRIAAFLKEAPKDSRGSLLYSPEKPGDYVFADGAGQTALFLASYGKLFEDSAAVKLARTQIGNFLSYGMDARSGLPYHGFDSPTGVKHGIIGWGRGTAWLLMGMAGVSGLGKETGYWDEAAALVGRILSLEREDHLFSWQLEALEGEKDTSTAAMLLWAMLVLREAGVPGAFTLERGIEIAHALQKEINGGLVYHASGECIDFGMYSRSFGPHPWGQGGCLAALARLDGLQETQKDMRNNTQA